MDIFLDYVCYIQGFQGLSESNLEHITKYIVIRTYIHNICNRIFMSTSQQSVNAFHNLRRLLTMNCISSIVLRDGMIMLHVALSYV